jgi:hypothetical protein
MTPEQIDALVVGRELDALVAEKAMDYKVLETDDCNGIDNFWLSRDGQNIFDNPIGWPLALPEVVEKLHEIAAKGIIIEQTFGGQWMACIGHNIGNVCDNKPIECETAPLAICKAALKAVVCG